MSLILNFNSMRYFYLLFILLLTHTNAYSLIISSNKFLQNEINKHFQDEIITKKDIEEYLIKNNYFQSNVLESGSNYTVMNPVQSIFIIKGNKFLHTHQIQKIIQTDETKFNINLNQTRVSSIKSAYQKLGFQNTTVRQKIKKEKFREWIYIDINEGLRTRILDIKVTGLLSRPSHFYSNFILNNSTPLIKEGYFNRKDLEKGYSNLITYLKSKGYLTSKIYPDHVAKKRNFVSITVSLKEGPLTLIKNISFEGNENISADKLISKMDLKVQSSFEQNTLDSDLEKIRSFYHDNGYLKMKFNISQNTITYDKKYQYAIINLNVQEGVKSTVSKIIIEDNNKIQEEFIKKSLNFKVGDVLTIKKINSTVSNLNSLGIFKNVYIDYDDKEDTTVTLRVEEKQLRSVRGGFGITTERNLTARSYLEYTHKNFLGYGRTLFTQLSGRSNILDKSPFFEYKISGNYQETFLIEQQINGNIGLSLSENIFSYFKDNINAVNKSQINFSVEKTFSSQAKADFTLWNLESRKEFCIDSLCPENLQKIGRLGVHVVYDTRDNLFHPKSGFLITATGEYATPQLGSSDDIQFWKAHVQNQFYISLLKNITLAFAFKGGVLSSSGSIPVGKAFLLGGQSSVRGYDGNIEGDRIPDLNKVPIKTANESLKLVNDGDLQQVQSTKFGLFKAELRFPFLENITSLVFYDIGTVNLKTELQDFWQYGHSIGIGFRYKTFIIPVGLDIGYKLHSESKSRYKAHLSLGLF